MPVPHASIGFMLLRTLHQLFLLSCTTVIRSERRRSNADYPSGTACIHCGCPVFPECIDRGGTDCRKSFGKRDPLWKLIAFGRVRGCIQWHQVPSFVRKQAWRLIQEAKTVVERYAGETDNVRYQYACNAAMCCVMGGEYIRAEENVLLSRKVDG